MKTCSKCKEEKFLTDFPQRKELADGYKNICKVCYNESCREKYRIKNNLPNLLENERICKDCKIVLPIDKFESHSTRLDGLQIRCTVCLPKFEEIQYIKNTNKRKKLGKEHFRLKDIEYRNKNREKVRNKRRLDEKKRRKEDVLYKLKNSVSSSINQYLQFRKSKKTVDILGCSIQEFKEYLESQFEEWMNWENRGRYNGRYNETWQIDHKIPISSAKSEEDVYKLSHYSNLQPMCSRLNLEKGNKNN